MSFKSNFIRIGKQGASGDLSVHGISNQELIDAAEAVYVGLSPLPPAAGTIEWSKVERGAEWSTAYAPSTHEEVSLGTHKLAIGVALMKDPGESFVWGQVMSVESDDTPRQKSGEDPGPVI